MAPGQGRGGMALWLGQVQPTRVAGRQGASRQRGRERSGHTGDSAGSSWGRGCSVRGRSRWAVVPWMQLEHRQVPLVSGRGHAGQDIGDSRLPYWQRRGGLTALPGHPPSRSPAGEPGPSRKVVKTRGRACPLVSGRAWGARIASPGGTAFNSMARPLSASRMSPENS